MNMGVFETATSLGFREVKTIHESGKRTMNSHKPMSANLGIDSNLFNCLLDDRLLNLLNPPEVSEISVDQH